jgi:protein-S-isoprenylcysteine O-methyltransferase Ste14
MKVVDLFQLASVGVFLLIFAARAFHLLLARKINPIAIGRGEKGPALVFELSAFAGLIIWLIAVVARATHASLEAFPKVFDVQFIDSSIARAIGAVLVGFAMLLFALAFLSFGNSWRVGFDKETPGKLVTSGVFAFSRNPIYVSIDLWFIGIALINGTVFFLIFALVAAVALHWQMLREEKFCAELYGEPYQSYRAQTARYFIW